MPTPIPANPKCPHARTRGSFHIDECFFVTLCDLVNKRCLLECGLPCDIYDDFVREFSLSDDLTSTPEAVV